MVLCYCNKIEHLVISYLYNSKNYNKSVVIQQKKTAYELEFKVKKLSFWMLTHFWLNLISFILETIRTRSSLVEKKCRQEILYGILVKKSNLKMFLLLLKGHYLPKS